MNSVYSLQYKGCLCDCVYLPYSCYKAKQLYAFEVSHAGCIVRKGGDLGNLVREFKF